MEAILSVDSPQKNFRHINPSSNSPLFHLNRNLAKDLGLSSENTTPKSQDQLSPNFKKNTSTSQIRRWPIGKPASMCSPGLSELQDNYLEGSTRYEDIIGQLESPKLSAKMQMMLNSNMNLSESIMKNTVRAVDESCIKLDNKDLQVELEIGGLKLHHLEKKVEGCLTSSKSTLALNAQISENASRLVTPQKSQQDFKSKSASQIHSPQDMDDDTLSPNNLQKDLNQLLNDEEGGILFQDKIKSPQVRSKKGSISMLPLNELRENDLRSENLPFNGQLNSQSLYSQGLKTLEKYMTVLPLSEKSQNGGQSASSRRESTQKLRSYFEVHNNTRAESKDLENKSLADSSKNRNSIMFSKPMECTFNNNITFQTNMIEKDGQEHETEAKDGLKIKESNYSYEDSIRTRGSRSNIIISSRASSINVASIFENEPRSDYFRREIKFLDDDGTERLYVLKPKETLTVQKLETICVDFSKEEKIFFSNQELNKLSNRQNDVEQLDSIQMRGIENTYTARDSSARSSGVMGQKYPDVNSERINIYDNSYIVSLNLDKQEKEKAERLAAFEQKAKFFGQGEANGTVYKMEDLSFNNLRLHGLNNSGAEIPVTGNRDEIYSVSTSECPTVCNRWDGNNNKETERPEFLLKQKISDFRNFLNEFEDAIITDQVRSPLQEKSLKENSLPQFKNWSAQARNSLEFKNFDIMGVEKQNLEGQDIENTPKIREAIQNEILTIRASHDNVTRNPKQKLQYLTDKSPKNLRRASDKVSINQNQENEGSIPYSYAKKRFSLTKNGIHSNSGMLKTKINGVIEEVDEAFGIPLKTLTISRNSSTVLLNSSQAEKKNAHKKSSNGSKMLKSSDRIKIDHDLKAKTLSNMQIIQNANIKCRKPSGKTIVEPKVEVVVLTKTPKRINNSLSEK